MRLAVTLLTFLVLAAGCAAERQAPGAPETGTSETTGDPGTGEMSVEQIAGGQSGLAERRVIVAGSAEELSAAAGVPVPDSGEGLYVSAHAGERPTGGYRVSISGAGTGEVRVTLREPGPGDIVTQALTQPYAVAVVSYEGGQTPRPEELRFADAAGEPLGWPVRLVEANG